MRSNKRIKESVSRVFSNGRGGGLWHLLEGGALKRATQKEGGVKREGNLNSLRISSMKERPRSIIYSPKGKEIERRVSFGEDRPKNVEGGRKEFFEHVLEWGEKKHKTRAKRKVAHQSESWLLSGGGGRLGVGWAQDAR